MGQEWNHSSIPSMGKRFSIAALNEAHSLPTSKGTSGFSLGVKAARARCWPLSSIYYKIKNDWSCTSFPPFMICTDIFTFTEGIGKIICMYITVSAAVKSYTVISISAFRVLK